MTLPNADAYCSRGTGIAIPLVCAARRRDSLQEPVMELLPETLS
jgi:hypothetical protein